MSVAKACFCKPLAVSVDRAESQAAATPTLTKASKMPAGGSMFDILHHSQLVFSAEMSGQLTALPLTFNRKTVQQMQVGLTGPGPTGGL